eukprot:gene13084-14426_t
MLVLVISPLVSLIRDQTDILQRLSIESLTLKDAKEAEKVEKLLASTFKIVFTSPEAILRTYRNEIKSQNFQDGLACVVVDESHCIVKCKECKCGDDDKCLLEKEPCKFFSSAEVSLMALDDDELDFLKSKLQELRANLCDGYTFLHTGFDIATGFPLQTIDDIVHSVDYIGNEEQIKNEFVLFNTNRSPQVYSIIQDIQLSYGNEVPFPGEIEDIKGSADSLIVDIGSDFDDKSESSDSSACSDYSVKMRSKYRSVILSDTDNSQEF